ncbi:hypothetical protein H072_3638 [Dactylellina haptotyla CBS 200.50]|uniref:Uncharacterized protein n=1 Tax=Dactylellina haptotyla (strain CBS 200.50) TaxID=1284197 RepID=S8AHB1_DACHA|nr:hypothetical protein H072_3638 [Dactylellina haptotyla CBS 200.50]
MSSSVTTAVPSGPILNWCIANQVQYGASDFYKCANETIGQKPADFQSICCDGDIIDIKVDFWQPNRPKSAGPLYLNIDDMVCCRYGKEEGGLHAINPTRTICTAGTPTPLASLAATNVNNAQAYLVTYESASQDGTSLGDWTLMTTPQCMWMNTNTKDTQGVGVKTVVVPAADITTLSPAATSEFGVFNAPPVESSSEESPQSTIADESTMTQQTDSPTTSGPSATTATTASTSVPNSSSNFTAKNLLKMSICTLLFSVLL